MASDTFADWTRAYVRQLRDNAARDTAIADDLELALEKYEAEHTPKPPVNLANGAERVTIAPHVKRGKKPERGDKNQFALVRLASAPSAGLSLDALYESFVERFGASYKRSSLRAMMFHQKKLGNVRSTSVGRYALAKVELGRTH